MAVGPAFAGPRFLMSDAVCLGYNPCGDAIVAFKEW